MNRLKLDNQLCFKLYSLNKNITKLYAPILKSLGLTYPQYLVMLILWDNNKAHTIKEIGTLLDLDTGTLSPMLKRMENNGFIRRMRSEEDERTVFVSPTTKGLKLKDKAKDIPSTLFALTELSLDQMLRLQESLGELIETTKRHIQP